MSKNKAPSTKRSRSKDKKTAKPMQALRDVSQGSIGSIGSNSNKMNVYKTTQSGMALNQYTRYISDLRKLAHTRKS